MQYTNKNMQYVNDKFSDSLGGSTKYSYVNFFDRVDIEAFIGILYLRAAFGLNITAWSSVISPNFLVWKFWGKAQFPHSFGRFAEHIGFKQCDPNKPAKYGLLYRSLSDSSFPHTYYNLPYAGKQEKVEGPAAKYYTIGTENYSKYLINGLSVYCNLQGINISMDPYFISVSLETWDFEKNITVVGTMEHDRKGIPKELKPVADREERSVMHVCNAKEKIMVVSYIDKKKSGKKNVIVLWTMHDNVKITSNQRWEPSVQKCMITQKET